MFFGSSMLVHRPLIRWADSSAQCERVSIIIHPRKKSNNIDRISSANKAYIYGRWLSVDCLTQKGEWKVYSAGGPFRQSGTSDLCKAGAAL
jgi:hypothetical protein